MSQGTVTARAVKLLQRRKIYKIYFWQLIIAFLFTNRRLIKYKNKVSHNAHVKKTTQNTNYVFKIQYSTQYLFKRIHKEAQRNRTCRRMRFTQVHTASGPRCPQLSCRSRRRDARGINPQATDVGRRGHPYHPAAGVLQSLKETFRSGERPRGLCEKRRGEDDDAHSDVARP